MSDLLNKLEIVGPIGYPEIPNKLIRRTLGLGSEELHLRIACGRSRAAGTNHPPMPAEDQVIAREMGDIGEVRPIGIS
jgi:hypothetical protein